MTNRGALPSARVPTLRLITPESLKKGNKSQMKVENYKSSRFRTTNESEAVKMLKNPLPLSTKEEIEEYISARRKETERYIAAATIQRFWREKLANNKKKKIRRTINFIMLSIKPKLLIPILRSWLEITQTSLIQQRNSNINALIRNRDNFGSLFWTFHVLRRLSIMNKHPRFLLGIIGGLYIPEWNFFKINYLTRKEQKSKAKLARIRYLGTRALSALNNYSIYRGNDQHEEEIYRIICTVTMKKALKALKENWAINSFHRIVKGRIAFEWYQYTYEKKILEAASYLFNKRRELILLKTFLSNWIKGGIVQSSSDMIVFQNVYANKSKLLPIVFLLRGDLLHFTFTYSFFAWRKKCMKKKRTRSFISFVSKDIKVLALKRFLFDCLRRHASLHIPEGRYKPFVIEQLVDENSQFEQRLNSIIRDKGTTLKAYNYPGNSADIFLFKGNNIIHDSLSIASLSSKSVRSIYYYVVLLLSAKTMKLKENSLYLKSLSEFRSKNNLNTLTNCINAWSKYSKLANLESSAMHKKLSRDKYICIIGDLQDSTESLKAISSNFSASGKYPSFYFETIVTEKIEFNDYLRLTKNMSENHPFMGSIKDLAKAFRDNEKIYRKAPKDAFPKYNQQRRKYNKTIIDKTSSNVFSRQATSLETFIPIAPTMEQAKLFSSRSFIFKEMKESLGLLEEKINKSTLTKESSNKNNFILLLKNLFRSEDTDIRFFITSDNLSKLPSVSIPNIPISCIEEYTYLGEHFPSSTYHSYKLDEYSKLSRIVIIIFFVLIFNKLPRRDDITTSAQSIYGFFCGNKEEPLPPLTSMKTLFNNDILEYLITMDNETNKKPSFVREFTIVINQMSSLFKDFVTDHGNKTVFFKEIQQHTLNVLSSIRDKNKNCEENNLEDVPSEYECRLFAFSTMFFLPISYE